MSSVMNPFDDYEDKDFYEELDETDYGPEEDNNEDEYDYELYEYDEEEEEYGEEPEDLEEEPEDDISL